jgi:hypothetical protein
MSEMLSAPPAPAAPTASTITIEAKQFGRPGAPLPRWEMELPAEAMTLRGFLERVVRREVAAFQERQEGRKTLRFLTDREIAAGAAAGKIDAGGRPETATEADADAAVAQALQAFADGLFYVFVDEQQHEDLDGAVALRPGSRVMFLRLTALAGG